MVWDDFDLDAAGDFRFFLSQAFIQITLVGILKAILLETEAKVTKPISAHDMEQHALIVHVFPIGQQQGMYKIIWEDALMPYKLYFQYCVLSKNVEWEKLTDITKIKLKSYQSVAAPTCLTHKTLPAMQ